MLKWHSIIPLLAPYCLAQPENQREEPREQPFFVPCPSQITSYLFLSLRALKLSRDIPRNEVKIHFFSF